MITFAEFSEWGCWRTAWSPQRGVDKRESWTLLRVLHLLILFSGLYTYHSCLQNSQCTFFIFPV